MSGTCPNNTVPPACYPGAKWTPNDPIFFLHHAVRATSVTRFAASPSSHCTMALQMVDKIWSDWQNKSAKNKYSYGGGSVAVSPDSPDFQEFSTGRPPFLNVSASLDLKRKWAATVSYALRSPPSLIAGSPVMVYGTETLRFGI